MMEKIKARFNIRFLRMYAIFPPPPPPPPPPVLKIAKFHLCFLSRNELFYHRSNTDCVTNPIRLECQILWPGNIIETYI